MLESHFFRNSVSNSGKKPRKFLTYKDVSIIFVAHKDKIIIILHENDHGLFFIGSPAY